MRAASRKFLAHTTRALASEHYAMKYDPSFLVALGELRGVFGTHLAHLSTEYRVQVTGDLARILLRKDSGAKLVRPPQVDCSFSDFGEEAYVPLQGKTIHFHRGGGGNAPDSRRQNEM